MSFPLIIFQSLQCFHKLQYFDLYFLRLIWQLHFMKTALLDFLSFFEGEKKKGKAYL